MTPYDASSPQGRPALIDGFGRTVSYLRLSVTDRCDLRCVYCMAEHMTFLPKAQVLSLEELDRIASAFVGLGTRKLRLTGGEPLVRKGMLDLVRRLGRHLGSGALGEVEADRTDQYLSLKDVRRELESFWTLEELPLNTGGPARYVRVAETGGRLGLITPLSHNFCEACNRVRLTCTGTLHTCLGQE